MKISSLVATVSVAATPLVNASGGGQAHPHGINCQGHALCIRDEFELHVPGGVRMWPPTKQTALKLNQVLQFIPDDVWIPYKDPVACTKWVCAFVENPGFLGPLGGMYGKTVRDLSTALIDHGCKRCGHVPLGYLSGINNDDYGRLTFDVHPHPCQTMQTGSGTIADELYWGLCPRYKQAAIDAGNTDSSIQ